MKRKLYFIYVLPLREYLLTIRECYWWSRGKRW